MEMVLEVRSMDRHLKILLITASMTAFSYPFLNHHRFDNIQHDAFPIFLNNNMARLLLMQQSTTPIFVVLITALSLILQVQDQFDNNPRLLLEDTTERPDYQVK